MNNGFVKNQRAHNLYVNKSMLRAILTVVMPSLAMTLMTGIYLFASQAIIIRLVPIAHGNDAANFAHWFGSDYTMDQIKDLCISNGTTFYSIGDIVKGSMSICTPIVTIIGTSPFFIAGGATVLFTQAMGRSSKYKAEQVFKTSFWMVIILSGIEILLLLSTNGSLLNAMSPAAEKPNGAPAILVEYYQNVHDLQIKMAQQWTLVYSAGLILPMVIFYFGSLIKSEGKFRVVVITSVCCNFLNIGFIFLFVLVAKIDMYGGSLSSTISYAINLIVILIYIWFLNRKQNTWLRFGMLFKKGLTKFKVNLIWPIILIGLSAFLIDISFAVANAFYIPILANTAVAIKFNHANGNGMYFQTIEGATMPTLNLIFITIYGIVDGERLIVAYNYSLGNWKRIKKAYWYTIVITFAYSVIAILLLCLALGKPILHLFDVQSGVMFNDAYKVLLIQSLMVVVFSFQVAAMSLFMAISDIGRSNISAIFQDIITFFPILSLSYGITMATGNIWILVSTYVINALVSTTLMTVYTIWWLKHRFGKIPMKINIGGVNKKLWAPATVPRPSFIQYALDWE